jgi:DNA-binding winged helix-turn-helix (wHTH) protein
MDPVPDAPASFEFGRFRILPQRREVLADGRLMELGGRAFDVLVVLIEAHGAVVSKDELMSRVWPGRIVGDNNLHVQIKVLRKAFSDHDLIRTIAATSSGARFALAPQAVASRPSRGRYRPRPVANERS